MLLLYSHFLRIFYRLVFRCKFLRPFVFLFVWSTVYSIGIFLARRKCVDLVVISNKRREETFAISLQNRKSCAYIKYFILVRPLKLVTMILAVKCTDQIKHWTDHLNFALNFTFVCFFSKRNFFHLKKCLSYLCLRWAVHVTCACNVNS